MELLREMSIIILLFTACNAFTGDLLKAYNNGKATEAPKPTVTEAAEPANKTTSTIAPSVIVGILDGNKKTSTDGTPAPPTAPESVHVSLMNDMMVDPGTTVQLKNLSLINPPDVEPGHYFENGIKQNYATGVHNPSTDGLFLVYSSVQMSKTSSEKQRRRRLTESQLQEVKVAVCINDEEALVHHGVLLGSQSTFSLSGVLQLKAGQEITVKITNKSTSSVKVLNKTSIGIHKLQ